MEEKVRCFEVRTTEGKPILRVLVSEITEDNAKPAGNGKSDPKKPNGQNSSNHPDDPLMTDAQKRYLFRILSDKGIEGDKAYDYLKDNFQVDTLKEVTKSEASKLIEQLLDNGKGGKSNGSSLQ